MTSVLAIEQDGEYVELADPAYKGYEVVTEEITNAERNTTGYLVKYRIATKVNITVSWKAIDADAKDLILSTTAGNSFGLRYYDPQDDTVKYILSSKGAYRGNDLSVTGYGRFDGTRFQYYDVSMSIIER